MKRLAAALVLAAGALLALATPAAAQDSSIKGTLEKIDNSVDELRGRAQ